MIRGAVPSPHLGVDFGGTKIDVAIGDRDGNVWVSRRLPTHPHDGAVQAVDRAVAAAANIAADYAVSAIGISSMGVTTETGVALAPNVPGWDKVDLYQSFHRQFPEASLKVGNDVKAAALAECLWGELRETGYGLYINLGTGIAVALTIDGHVYQGAHGAAGEIAYYWRNAMELGFGTGCAPLEEKCGGRALETYIAQHSNEFAGMAELVNAVRNGDAAAAGLLETLVEPLAWGLSLTLITLDVERAVIGGGMSEAFDVLSPILTRVWEKYVPFVPLLTASQFGAAPGIRGALALAAQSK